MAFAALNKVRSVGMLSTSTLPIAIDFGIGSLKMLQVAPGQPPTLIAAAQVETPDDVVLDHAKRFEFQAEALTRLVKAVAFKGKRAICGIPAVQMFCKHLQFPRSETDIGSLIESTVPMQLGCHPGALAYRHVVVSGTGEKSPADGQDAGAPTGPKTEVICFAVPRDLIVRIMGLLRSCRLEPVGIHPNSLALLRAFESAQPAEIKDATVLYLDLGAGSTTCLITHGKNLVFAKTIHLGGRHLDEAVARQLRCGITEARSQRLGTERLLVAPGPSAVPPRPGSPARGPGTFDLSGTLETLTDEIAMCVRYHESLFPGRRVGRAIFVGGEARHRGLCQHVAKALRLPAHVADPLARLNRTGAEPCVDIDLSQPQPAWGAALGLCLSPTDF